MMCAAAVAHCVRYCVYGNGVYARTLCSMSVCDRKLCARGARENVTPSHQSQRSSPCSSSHLASFSWCPPLAEYARTCASSHGAPCSRAHCITSRCPPSIAKAQVSVSHSQPCSRAHCNTSRCPPKAALEHVSVSHSQPCSRAYCKTSRCPPSAAEDTRPPVPRAVVLVRPPQHLQAEAYTRPLFGSTYALFVG